jgi:MoxR-like ATPase
LDYVARLVCATHPGSEDCPESVGEYIRFGSSPRGAQALLRLGKARALSKGRDHMALEDVQALAKPVFRHRIHLSFEGETEGVTADSIVETILREVTFEQNVGK